MRTLNKIKELIKSLCETYQTTATPEEIRDEIYRKIQLLRKVTNVESETVNYIDLSSKLLGLFYNIFFDRKYSILTNVVTFRKLITIDWVNYYKYISELRDCDDFARIFKSHMEEIWLINGVGYAIGRVYDLEGNLLGYHAFNLVPIKEGEKIRFMVYEPQTDHYNDLDPGNKTKIGGKYIYVIDLVIW